MHSQSTGDAIKGLGDAERQIVVALSALERHTVTADDVVSAFGVRRVAANLVLSRLARKGWLRRLRRGVYSVVPLSSRSGRPPIEDPLAVAMQLFAPCYVSGWTAAQHWDLTEQIHNAVVVYSAKPQRRSTQPIGGVTYRIRRVPEHAIFGTMQIWSGTVAVQMATAHRTVIDVLDAPDLGGGGRQVIEIVRAYWSRSLAEPRTLLELAVRLGRGTVFKRLGFTAERFGHVGESWLRECREHLSAGVSLLDPSAPAGGRIVSRWRLRINVPVGGAA